MTYGFVYWFLMLCWVVFGFWQGPGWTTPDGRRFYGGHAIVFFLFLVLGLHIFGWPIKG